MLTAADLLLRALSAAPDLFEAIVRIGQIWTRQGAMTDAEFAAFKARAEAEFGAPHWQTDEQLAGAPGGTAPGVVAERPAGLEPGA